MREEIYEIIEEVTKSELSRQTVTQDRILLHRNRMNTSCAHLRSTNVNGVVRVLREERVNVNGESKSGYTGFILGCGCGNVNVVQVLVKDKRVDVNKRYSNGSTGFMFACQHGHDEIVSLLMEDERIDVNGQNNDGLTGLMWACESGRVSTVRLLLKNPAIDRSLKTKEGESAVDIARRLKQEEIVSLLS